MIKRLMLPLLMLLLGLSCACPALQLPIVKPKATATPTVRLTKGPTQASTLQLSPPATLQPGIDWDDRSIFGTGLIQAQQKYLESLGGASYYLINIHIADNLQEISGSESVRYTNQEDEALEVVHFRLYPNILGGWTVVTSVNVDGSEVTPEYRLNNSLMIVPLSPALQPGESVVVQMEFQVHVPANGEQNYGVFAISRGVLALSHFYPDISVYNENGWNSEIPDNDGDVTFNDAAFYLVTVEMPAGMVPVASGREIERQQTGKMLKVRYANGPGRDFYLAASRDFSKISETSGEVSINAYFLPGNEKGAQKALEVARDSIQIFSQRYAPYPYTEFDIVPISTLALGIEYPGLVAINMDIFPEYLDAFNPELETTIAHEVGHQWFYNMVGDDQMDEPYLDESLTQFVTWQYFKDQHGETEARDFEAHLRSWWYGASDQDMVIGMPVSGYSSEDYGAIVYGKGAFFFAALEEKMGSETFGRFMQAYTEIYTWGIASTEGLKEVAEEFCNCDLGQLFEEWVYPK
jgi:hypothetical protein